jgi:hypothetical protein
MHAHAIAAVRAEWTARCRTAHASAVLDRLVDAEPELTTVQATNLGQLFAAIDQPTGCAVEHWRIVAALIRQFDTDELVGLGLVATLSPALLRVARRLDWGQGGPWPDAQSFATDLVTETWLVVSDMAGESYAYPERAVIDRLRRRLVHHRARFQAGQQRETPTEDSTLSGSTDGLVGFACEPRRATTLDSLAVALSGFDAHLVRREDLRLVFATRVLGYSIAELADRGEGCKRTLEYRRSRAEAVLCA